MLNDAPVSRIFILRKNINGIVYYVGSLQYCEVTVYCYAITTATRTMYIYMCVWILFMSLLLLSFKINL